MHSCLDYSALQEVRAQTLTHIVTSSALFVRMADVDSSCPGLLCRDQDDLVTLEAVKALFGQLPPYNPSVMTGATAQSPQEELVSNRMRIRAWSMVASQVSLPCFLLPLLLLFFFLCLSFSFLVFLHLHFC